MFKLIAKFNIQLQDGNLLICRPLSEELRYKSRIDNFDIELCLNPDFKLWRNLETHSRNAPAEEPFFALSKVQVVVARDENVEPPSVQIINGIAIYEERHRYFTERKSIYQKMAMDVLNRAILFFKYRLHNPQLYMLTSYSAAIQNPT